MSNYTLTDLREDFLNIQLSKSGKDVELLMNTTPGLSRCNKFTHSGFLQPEINWMTETFL